MNIKNLKAQFYIYNLCCALTMCGLFSCNNGNNTNTSIIKPSFIPEPANKLFCAIEQNTIDKLVAESFAIYQNNPNIKPNTTVGLSVGLYQNGQICYFNYGKTNISYNAPATTNNTLYEIGSLTKTLTAAVLAYDTILGKVSFNAPISSEINNFPISINLPDNYKDLTYLQYANMSAGFPDYPTYIYYSNLNYPYNQQSFNFAQFKNFLESETIESQRFSYPFGDNSTYFNFMPTGTYNYSDMSYGLLGMLLINLNQSIMSESDFDNANSFNNMINSSFTNNLNMPCTSATMPAYINNNCNNSIATGYYYSNNNLTYAYAYPWSIGYGPGGNLKSTTKDMVNYIQALLGHNLIKDESGNVVAQVTPKRIKALQITLDRDITFYYPKINIGYYWYPNLNTNQVMAWEVADKESSSTYFKNGSTTGANSAMILNIDNATNIFKNDFGVIALANTNSGTLYLPEYLAWNITNNTPKSINFNINYKNDSNKSDILTISQKNNVIWNIPNNQTQAVTIPSGQSLIFNSSLGQCNLSFSNESINISSCNGYTIILPTEKNNYLMQVY